MAKFKLRSVSLTIFLVAATLLTACGDSTPTSVPTTTSAATTAAAATTTSVTTTVATTAATTISAATTAAATSAAATNNAAQLEPKAGSWKTWLLTSGSQFRRKAPPDQAATQAEIKQLKDMIAQRTPAALDQIAFWNSGAPGYQWTELLINQSLKNNLGFNLASRHLALLQVGIYDGMIAAWDSKYTFNRPRPSELDASLTTVIPNPRYPGYPSEYAVTAAVAADILAYVFPDEAKSFQDKAQEAVKSRLLAGVEYPSDIEAGLELGHLVAALVIDRGKADGSDAKWTGAVPTEAGKWNGTNPVQPLAGTWKTWILSTPNEFRPGPPPAFDSAQELAELNELKNFQRTPKSNADAFFWEYAGGGTRIFQYWPGQLHKKLFEYRLDSNPVQAARANALFSTVFYDAGVGCWEAKYFYWAARPFMVDKEFKPLFTTPNHPSYPAAHGCVSTGAADILGYIFPRDAKALDAIAAEAAEARMWGGIHFRSDIIAGRTLGHNVAGKAIEKAKKDNG